MQLRGYRVDEVHRTVTSPAGHVTRLEPQAFDLLVYFTSHPEETLGRDRLVADVWGGKFITDDAVQVAVYAIRQAFDDDPKSPRFIETIRGRGYRWIAKADAEVPKRARWWIAPAAAVLATSFAALVWAVLRPPQPMPTIRQTSELVRAQARGLFFSQRTTREDFEKARAEFRKAIAVDDRFAEPHAALAETCVRLIELGSSDRQACETEARREVRRAMELGPRLALSHAALASVQFVLDRDVVKAERSFLDALQLDPSLPDIHRRYAYLLGATGRFARAEEEAKIAADMEPASAGAISDLAWTHVLAGDLPEAERLYRDALRLDPANAATLFSLGYCLDLRGAPVDAMNAYRRAMQVRGVPAEFIANCDRLYASGGLPAVYASWLERLAPNKQIPRFVIAFYAARAGRASRAIELLRESEQRHEAANLWLPVHPAFATLHGQPEFASLAASSFKEVQ